MQADFPKLPSFIIDYILDVYEKDPEFFKKQKGRPRKTNKAEDTLKKIDDAIHELQCVEFKEPPSQKDMIPSNQTLNIVNPADDSGKPETIKLTF